MGIVCVWVCGCARGRDLGDALCAVAVSKRVVLVGEKGMLAVATIGDCSLSVACQLLAPINTLRGMPH